MDIHWLRGYLIRNGGANICQLMKEQDDPVGWLKQRVAPEFWRRINDAWTQYQIHLEPTRPGYITREVSAHSTTWALVDAILKDANESGLGKAETAEVDMNSLLVQAGLTWFGRAKTDEILRAARADKD